MDEFKQTWEVICDYCKNEITDVAYKTWISRIEPVSLDFEKGIATIMAPNDFHRQTLTKFYLSLLTKAFKDVFGADIKVNITVPEDNDNQQQQQQEKDIENGDYEYTFDTFIVGSSNNFAHAAAQAVAANPANAYNPLFIYGNSGLGKTHLLKAIGNEIKKNNENANILYVRGDEFANEIIDAIRTSKTKEFREKYRFADVFLVDDVQFIGGKDATQEEFFHTFNSLYEAKSQIVLTSDRPPKEIKTLEDRIRSRFESGLIADIQPPDFEIRVAIIKRKAELLGIVIPDEICNYIAQKLKSNIRQLEGVVKKLKAKNMLSGEKINMSSAQDTISDILNSDVPPQITVENIIEEVARTYGVEPEDIRSLKSRKASLSNARHIAIYITRNLTNLVVKQIGDEFGGRHYSTVLHSINHVEELMKKDLKVKETVEDIIKNIRDR